MQQNPNVQVPFSTVFPGSRIPDWFKHRSQGHEINIKVSPNWYTSNFLGFALSAVIAPEKEFLRSGWLTYCNFGCRALKSKWESNHVCSFIDAHTCQLEHTIIESDHLWLAYIPSIFGFNCEKLSQIKFSFVTDRMSCTVKRCGVCPVYIKSSSDEDYSYIDEGNPSGSDLDDLHEWEIEDNTIKRSAVEARSRGSVQEDVNDSMLQHTIIRSLDEAEPREIVYSYTNAHAYDQEMLQMEPDPSIFQYGNAHYISSGNVPDNLWGKLHHKVLEDVQQSVSQDTIATRRSHWEEYSLLEDTIIRSHEDAEPEGIGYSCTNAHWEEYSLLEDTIIRSLDDAEPEGTGYSCTNAHACDQEMLQMRPDPFIFQCGNAHYIPAGSAHDNICVNLHHEVLEDVQQSVSQDTIARRRSHWEEYSLLEDTIIRSLDDAEAKGIGYSCTNAHACDQEKLQMKPNPFIFQNGNAHHIPGGSVPHNLSESLHHEILENVQQLVSQDTLARRRSLGEEYSVLQDSIIRSLDDAEPRGIEYSCTNAHACNQEML